MFAGRAAVLQHVSKNKRKAGGGGTIDSNNLKKFNLQANKNRPGLDQNDIAMLNRYKPPARNDQK